MRVMREHHHAARRVHHVVVEFPGEALPQLQRVVVEGGRFLPQIIGPQDCRVAAGVAAAKPALLEHGDFRQPMLLGQIIGGCEPMPAGSDDDRVVGTFRLGTAPLLGPALILRERLPRHVEKRKPHWTRPPLNRLIEGGRLPCPARDCEHNFAGFREVFRIWRDTPDRDGVHGASSGDDFHLSIRTCASKTGEFSLVNKPALIKSLPSGDAVVDSTDRLIHVALHIRQCDRTLTSRCVSALYRLKRRKT